MTNRPCVSVSARRAEPTGYCLLTTDYSYSDRRHVVVLHPRGDALAPDEVGESHIVRRGEQRIKLVGFAAAPRERAEVPGGQRVRDEQEGVARLGTAFRLDYPRERRLAQRLARRDERR